MSEKGVRVTVSEPNGPKVGGWLISNEPEGFYVALDSIGREIRLIPHQTGVGITYHHNAKKAAFAPTPQSIDALRRFQKEAESECVEALSWVDYNQVRRISTNYWQLVTQVWSSHSDPSFYDLREILVRADVSNRELGAELDRSGLGIALKKYSETIRMYLSLETLPAVDKHLMSLAELKALIVRAKEQNRIRKVSSFEEAIALPALAYEPAQKGEERNKRSNRMKRWTALGRIGLSGLFATLNIGVGVFTGVVSALPTLGIGAVSATVAVMGSTYTGVNGCLDGIKLLAESDS